jgi:phospholipid/cholesterol/gamma-HCH transport system substrate-binding protein
MKIKFNKYERVAGLFVLTAMVGSLVAFIGIAIKKGWFEPKVSYETTLKNAEGVREGTQVQISGLRAGVVTEVDLKSGGEVHVKFEVLEKFHSHVRDDSVVRTIRPFIIGEKILDVSVGSDTEKLIAEHGLVQSAATADIMDLVSGKTLAPYFETVGKMAENLKYVAEAILDPQRSKQIVKMFDDLMPLVHNVSGMSREVNVILKDVNKNRQLGRVVENLVAMTDILGRALPQLQQDAPELAEDFKKIARNTAVLTTELQKTLPLLQEMGPELPKASRRAMEALDETVVTLKALQKSFLLRGSVKDVRDEEARVPASDKATKKDLDK